MKNILIATVLLICASSHARSDAGFDAERDCEKYISPVTYEQLYKAAATLQMSGQLIQDPERALSRLQLIAGKVKPNEMTNEQYYAFASIARYRFSTMELATTACPREFEKNLSTLQKANEIVRSISEQISTK